MQIMDQFVRGIFVQADLFENHLPFFFYIGLRELGMQQHVAENVQAQPKMFGQDLDIITSILTIRCSVQLSADIVDLFGDVAGRAFFRPFEHQVFNEMGYALLRQSFRAGSSSNKETDAYRAHIGNGLR